MRKIFYSLLATLMMTCAVECSAQTVSGNKGGHDYVDLGLPSGRLWATCNVGASKPTEYGDYFAWGETTPKVSNHYKFRKDTTIRIIKTDNTYTKYVMNNSYGTVDSITTLLAEDDAATANWGAEWRMPTFIELLELTDECDWKWTKDYNGSGVAGEIGTSKTNGNTIFLPAAGYRIGENLARPGNDGNYWSSSLGDSDSLRAYSLYIDTNSNGYGEWFRYFGQSVRAVMK